MPYKSPFTIDIPRTDLLTYLFPPYREDDVYKPLWISTTNPSISLSRKQALQWIRRMAVGLQKLQLKTGDVVLMISPNHVFVPVAYLGSIAYGAVFSGLTPLASVDEIVYQMKHTGAKVLLVHPTVRSQAVAASKIVGLPQSRVLLFSDTDCGEIDGINDWKSVIGTNEEAQVWQWQRLTYEESKNRVAVINYSSGTTGLPKGVCISHHNLIANVEQCMFNYNHLQTLANHDPQRWLNILPLYHAFGQLWNIVMACKYGITTYVMGKFHFDQFLHHVQTYRITQVVTAPPLLVMLSKRPETSKFDISSLGNIICGGAPLSKELQNDVAWRFRVSIKQTWGGTELTCSATLSPGGMKDENGSAGMLLPNMECKLLDDEGKEVGIGERGEAYFKGPNICLGYWRNEAATTNAISADTFYRTGDVAIRDKSGMFYVVDRKKEMIKVSGFQVAPAELEALLLENENIADAAVVGVKRGESECPRAYVVLKSQARGQLDAPTIERWLAGRVASYKRLRGGVAFIDEVPKSASGKIQRKVIREWAERYEEIETKRSKL